MKTLNPSNSRKAELAAIVTELDDILHECGAHTSVHFVDQLELQDTARFLIQLIDTGGIEGYLQTFVPRARWAIRQAKRLEPYDNSIGSS